MSENTNGPGGLKQRWNNPPNGPEQPATRTITSSGDVPEAFPQGVTIEDQGAGSPFGVGPQSEALVKRSRVVVNPARRGESEK